MKKYSLFSFALLLCLSAFGQDFKVRNTYRTKENPHYWKNRRPRADYWQQDVHYQIRATIDDERDIIEGNYYKLTYYNNSPHTINELYFHLNENAFQPNSHYHNLWLNNGQVPEFGKYEKQGLGTTVENLQVNGQPAKTVLDNTIMQVQLNTPLKSGDSLVVTMQFKTYFDNGSMRRRMKQYEKYGYKHYNGVHWYPSVSVYDPKFTWTTEQHLDKEFYGNFGTFDVALTFPQEYIVEATGTLQNEQEVMPKDLRDKLDIKNFKDKPFGSAPSVIIPREAGKTKTWVYHGENVHNFAFTADPLYRIGEFEWNGIKAIALAQEPHAARWQQSAWFAAQCIRVYSEDFGMYAWPKIIVADAEDGMEYPMITLDAGTYPQHQSLLAHEIGHMWFYGMVANNETYRAYLDEGFTQFLTVWCMEKLTGYKTTTFQNMTNVRYGSAYYPYFLMQYEGLDMPLNTHSSDFRGALRQGGGYGLVYYKTAVMLYNLRYVLGDELFQKAMQHYFNKWKMAHPYTEDMRQAFIEYTQTDLNWFFDQWLDTTKELDYGITGVKAGKEQGTYEISFRRKADMQMPLDFRVTDKAGKTYDFHIPNTWFVKKTEATVLDKWYGWGEKLHPTHTATIRIDGEFDQVQIDPSYMLADRDLTDNTYKGVGFKGNQAAVKNQWTLLPKTMPTDWQFFRNQIRPDIWYNNYDGIQAGLHSEGNYMKQNHFYSATVWYNTRLGQWDDIPSEARKKNNTFAFSLTHKHSTRHIWKQSYLSEYLTRNAGLWKGGLTFEKDFKNDLRTKEYFSIFATADFMRRDTATDSPYLLFPQHWSIGQNNSSLTTGIIRRYDYRKGQGEVTLEARMPSLLTDFNYSYLQLNAVNDNLLGKLEVKTRFFGRAGFGGFPLESALYLASASPEQLFNNRFTRARGFVPTDWLGYGNDINHFHQGGGLNLRGFAGYLAPTDAMANYVGKSGAGFNVEVDFDRYLAIKGTQYLSFDTYLFSDAGMLASVRPNGKQDWGKFRLDAGVGTAMHIKFGSYDIKPLTLRFDMPFYVNTPPTGEDNFQFRYVVGVNRAF